jgi:hypothetical protein
VGWCDETPPSCCSSGKAKMEDQRGVRSSSVSIPASVISKQVTLFAIASIASVIVIDAVMLWWDSGSHRLQA